MANNGGEEHNDPVGKAYASISSYEHHFNDMETEVRKLASAWLLVALGAIGYTVRQQLTQPMLDAKLLIVIVCLMANVGLVILWILDQMVYHRLLNAVFLLGLRLEYAHDELPPIRTLMMVFSERRGMSRYIRLFYLLPMSGFAVLGAIGAAWRLLGISSTGSELLGVLSLALITAAIPVWAWQSGQHAESYAEVGAGFGDAKFVDYLEKKRFETVLAKH